MIYCSLFLFSPRKTLPCCCLTFLVSGLSSVFEILAWHKNHSIWLLKDQTNRTLCSHRRDIFTCSFEGNSNLRYTVNCCMKVCSVQLKMKTLLSICFSNSEHQCFGLKTKSSTLNASFSKIQLFHILKKNSILVWSHSTKVCLSTIQSAVALMKCIDFTFLFLRLAP